MYTYVSFEDWRIPGLLAPATTFLWPHPLAFVLLCTTSTAIDMKKMIVAAQPEITGLNRMMDVSRTTQRIRV